MLESCVHQGAGLQRMAALAQARLVAMVSHGQQQGELPLLWGLCHAWVDMGLSVLVLDGHAHESERNPGLLQRIADGSTGLPDDTEANAWTVLPAAEGLLALSHPGAQALLTLAELFAHYAVVLVYADAGLLGQGLKRSGLTPLVVVPPMKSALLSAYQALKQLLLDAQLRPTVANIALPLTHPPSMPSNDSPHPLQLCAAAHLGYEFRPMTVLASVQDDRSREGLGRLALALLENAVLLERRPVERMH